MNTSVSIILIKQWRFCVLTSWVLLKGVTVSFWKNNLLVNSKFMAFWSLMFFDFRSFFFQFEKPIDINAFSLLLAGAKLPLWYWFEEMHQKRESLTSS